MIGNMLILLEYPISFCDQVSDALIGLGKSLQQYPTLLRRVQKLRAYYRFAWRVKKLPKDRNFFKLRGNIRFVEVSFSIFLEGKGGGFLNLESLKDYAPLPPTAK